MYAYSLSSLFFLPPYPPPFISLFLSPISLSLSHTSCLKVVLYSNLPCVPYQAGDHTGKHVCVQAPPSRCPAEGQALNRGESQEIVSNVSNKRSYYQLMPSILTERGQSFRFVLLPIFFFEILSDLNQAVPNHLTDKSQTR